MNNKKLHRYFQLLFFSILVAWVVLGKENIANAAAIQKGTVTASKLNIRSNAGVKYSSVGTVVKGSQVTILSKKKDTEKKLWYKITVPINEKEVTGYVSADYVTINVVPSYIRRYGVINASALNIRKTPSTAATIVTKGYKGTSVYVIGKKNVKGETWYQLSLTVNGKKYTGYTLKKYITLDKISMDSDTYELANITSDKVNLYKNANVDTELRAVLSKNQEVIILGTIKVASKSWCKLKVKMNDTAIYGYVPTSKLKKVTSTVKETLNLKAKVKSKAASYRIASIVAGKVKTLSAGKSVTVKGKLTVNNVNWYLCKFTVSGQSYTGYMKADTVQLEVDAEFEESLSYFPKSYHSYLRALHEKYPKWKFKAIETGLDWNSVIENESKVGRNTIQSNVPKGGSYSSYSAPFSYLSTEPGAYNWATDTYTVMDGSNWYTANSEVIAYYMDPRNALTEEKIMQFESLAHDTSHTSSMVKSILKNTFMNDSFSVVDKYTNQTIKGNYAEVFYEAARISGASSYFLASRSKQELGVNGSGSSSGKYPGYEGYYNYYNIGAFDSSSGLAIANGLRWASSGNTYMRPWTNPYKSIVGGAQYIAQSYINKGQNTGYFQKFNVVYSPFYTHQYMTNVMAPQSEARSQYNSYNALGVLNDTFVFYIPVYQNMPSSPCKLPEVKGNPNNYLKTITVKNGSRNFMLTPTFSYLKTEYDLVVDHDVEQVTVGASTISKYATVSGTGTYQLTAGSTRTVELKCVAGNGTVQTYKVRISRR